MEQYMCETPFWNDPSVLFRHFRLQYTPLCENSPWNFIVRIIIISVFVGGIANIAGDLSFLLVSVVFGIITASVIIISYSISNADDSSAESQWDKDWERGEEQRMERGEERREKRHEEREKQHELQKCHMDCDRKFRDEYQSLPFTAVVYPSRQENDPSRSKENYTTEHFVNGGSAVNGVQPYSNDVSVGTIIGSLEVDAAPYSGPSLPDYTPPTSRNPFMNILLDEYKYNPNRPEAAPVGNGMVKQTIDDYFRVNWFSDPTDVFGKNQNQRQYVTQPSTTVPNDQGSFANWLYKIPGKTCKEGGRAACLAGSDGGMIPWLTHAS